MEQNDDYIVDGEENRPATLTDVALVIELLNKHNVPYLLIGGYAMMLQGNQRTTQDIDIVLPLGYETGKKVKKALSNLPEKASDKIKDEWFEEDETIRVADEFTVDLLFKCGGGGKYNYANLSQYAEEKELNGIKVKTITPEGLWYTKQTGREKDLPDLLFLNELLKMKGISVHKDLSEDYSFKSIKEKIKNKFFK
ncbi:hypothetical protein GW796_07685 [archaeon]|nr:hypothetical protein [archaeon]